MVASRLFFFVTSAQSYKTDAACRHITSCQHEDDVFFARNRFKFISDQFHTTSTIYTPKLSMKPEVIWNLKHGVPKMNIYQRIRAIVTCQV